MKITEGGWRKFVETEQLKMYCEVHGRSYHWQWQRPFYYFTLLIPLGGKCAVLGLSWPTWQNRSKSVRKLKLPFKNEYVKSDHQGFSLVLSPLLLQEAEPPHCVYHSMYYLVGKHQKGMKRQPYSNFLKIQTNKNNLSSRTPSLLDLCCGRVGEAVQARGYLAACHQTGLGNNQSTLSLSPAGSPGKAIKGGQPRSRTRRRGEALGWLRESTHWSHNCFYCTGGQTDR